ncbi:MAG: S8/S53 family peptidase [Bryobacterales bacterium]|nr:S8/S53 family peptidase [Bryobacterales bacterium]
MIISIINTTSRPRQEIQDKIRAVNRQLQEDFRRYWHIDAQLRLEGWTGDTIDPKNPLNMRGDAVIYLWGDDSTTKALGYHDLTHRGVPYGFVFPSLSKRLGEDWSVTLSHEALELAVDPEVNRLVQGPHPDPREGGRIVYHWYELCDAVQADTYSVDGIEVSNFLLPLYFTESEEHRNHNDFLGRGVASFGVRDGGYVGFFDPEKRKHDTYHAPDDKDAPQRLAVKAEYANAKRTGRRGSGVDALNDPRLVSCEAISFEFKEQTDDASSLLENASALIQKHCSGRWQIEACLGDPKEFDAVYTGASPVSFAEAWEIAHGFEAEPDVVYAEPSFTFPVPGETDAADDDTRRRASAWGGRHKRGTERSAWALEQCNIPAAWTLVKDSGKNPGEGVLIGHPDSGFIEHYEMDLDRVRIDFDRDFVEDDQETRTKDGRHGLATASVIMSGECAVGDMILGPATHAEILPLRVTKPGALRPAPVLFCAGMRRLRNAVDYAVRHGCQVISMSLGGLPSKSVRKAIRRSNERGVIVCAAAGNYVRFVVWPAYYPETIAAAGSNVDRGPWAHSSRGPAVDVVAPAESVWRATVSEKGDQVVRRGHGTSYAVALTAGIAAVWRAYHSQELKKRHPSEIPALFRRLLKRTASKKHQLGRGFGAGIVDAKALLDAPLPRGRRVRARSSLVEPGARELVRKLTGLNDIPEALGQELLCAKALLAMISASEPPIARGRTAPLPTVGDGTARLSPKLTEWLASNRR